MDSTHDKVRDLVASLEGAMTRLHNSERELSGDPEQDFDAWDEFAGAARFVEDAGTMLAEAVRAQRNAAEEALPE